MSRRLFDYLFVELSVAVGTRIPRYALWLHLHDLGWNPEALKPADVLTFCDGPMESFLADLGFRLSRRARNRLRKSLEKFDPLRPLPHEILERWSRSE
jgi:hypothetical protein